MLDNTNTDTEEKEMKRKIKVKKNSNGVWILVSASGFFPEVTQWTEEELKDYLVRNDDINPSLVF